MVYRAFAFLILLFFGNACNSDMVRGGLNEGQVEYDIQYLQDERENPVIGLMPKTLNLTFKDRFISLKMEGWMGIFKTTIISNLEDNTSSTLLKIMNNRYCYNSKLTDPAFGFDSMPGMLICETGQVEERVGYSCNVAKVSFPDSLHIPSFKILYTRLTDVDSPNRYTPYHQINGVLMEFRLSMNGIPMVFTAKAVKKISVSPEEFKVPQGYELVNRQKLQELVDSLF